MDPRRASQEPTGCEIFQKLNSNFTISGESVLLVLLMISSSLWKRKTRFVKRHCLVQCAYNVTFSPHVYLVITFFLTWRASSSFAARSSRSWRICSALARSLACSSSRCIDQNKPKCPFKICRCKTWNLEAVFVTWVYFSYLFLQQGCLPQGLSSLLLGLSLLLLLTPNLLLDETLSFGLLSCPLLCPLALQLFTAAPEHVTCCKGCGCMQC